jgi:hypothetical protein
MNPLQTKTMPRDQLSAFLPSPRAIKAFEGLQGDVTSIYGALASAQFLTLALDPNVGSERVFTPVSGDLTGTDGGANGAYTLGLANTTVTPGTYGNAAGFVTITVDAKGRATGVSTFALTASSGIAYNSTTGAFTAVKAGTYGAPTGTLQRTAFASYTAGTLLTYSLVYVQAEQTAMATRMQAVEAALQDVSRTLAALITDMKANGNLA